MATRDEVMRATLTEIFGCAAAAETLGSLIGIGEVDLPASDVAGLHKLLNMLSETLNAAGGRLDRHLREEERP